MSRKNTDRFYITIQIFFVIVAVSFFFVSGCSLLNEISWGDELFHGEKNNSIKSISSAFENDEFLKVFHDLSKGCDDQLATKVETIPENELNELYQFLTKNHANIKFDEQNQKEKSLVTCAISAAESIGVPAYMLPDFIDYAIRAASHVYTQAEPDAFLVYAAENFVANHNEWGMVDGDGALLYKSLDIIFEFMVYLLLIIFLFLLMRIERNTRK